MREKSSATVTTAVTADRVIGLTLGALGVLAFSMSLPATRVAVQQLDPWFVAFGRAVGAALLAWAYLRFTGAPRPTRSQWRRLPIVALGVVVGFPLFTSLALTTQTSAHGAVVITVLPAMTAVFAVLRAGERPPPLFWVASVGGLAGGARLPDHQRRGARRTVGRRPVPARGGRPVWAGIRRGRRARPGAGRRPDDLLGAAALAARHRCPSRSSPPSAHPPHADAAAWSAFGYLTVISMFLGFFAWYAGLARGGVAQVGQIQLAQPVLTLLWSALLLGETVTPASIGAALAVLGCVVLIQRASRFRPKYPPGPFTASPITRQKSSSVCTRLPSIAYTDVTRQVSAHPDREAG